MTHIGGGNATSTPTRSFAPSVRAAEDELASVGYDGIEFTRVGRQFRAVSRNAAGYRIEAIGYSEVLAAQSLVRVLRMK